MRFASFVSRCMRNLKPDPCGKDQFFCLASTPDHGTSIICDEKFLACFPEANPALTRNSDSPHALSLPRGSPREPWQCAPSHGAASSSVARCSRGMSHSSSDWSPVHQEFAFDAVGIVDAMSAPASAGLSLLNVSSFDTNFTLVAEDPKP